MTTEWHLKNMCDSREQRLDVGKVRANAYLIQCELSLVTQSDFLIFGWVR
jgi:hypothetical protein